MPRNGDGSSDNGPFEAHEIVHGTSGDKTLQHTKHVAPMPKGEAGEALPGMNASGGAAAPLNQKSEEYGASAPRYERFGDDENSNTSSKYSESRNDHSAASASSHQRDHSSGQDHDASRGDSSRVINNTSHREYEGHDLEKVSREKAERFVNLNEEDVDHASARHEGNYNSERSSQRAPRDVGAKDDIERSHGKANARHDSKRNDDVADRKQRHEEHNHYRNDETQRSHQGDRSDHGVESNMRHQAAKFVNIDE